MFADVLGSFPNWDAPLLSVNAILTRSLEYGEMSRVLGLRKCRLFFTLIGI